jgi:hypothetical protein
MAIPKIALETGFTLAPVAAIEPGTVDARLTTGK